MVCTRLVAFALVAGLVGATPATAQSQDARARLAYDEGVRQMRTEAFEAAARSFEFAVEADPTFDMAFYMLGRAHMALKNFVLAVRALTTCRDLHLAEASRVFQDSQEANRLRRERVQELHGFIRELEQISPQTDQIREQIRQFQERIRQLEDPALDAGLQRTHAVPAYVWLSLGSAYFRSGNLAEAEKAYVASVAADSKMGEAHNNLAVVYMETGRYDEAERAVKDAEKAGMWVSQALKDEIRRRKGKGKTWDQRD